MISRIFPSPWLSHHARARLDWFVLYVPRQVRWIINVIYYYEYWQGILHDCNTGKIVSQLFPSHGIIWTNSNVGSSEICKQMDQNNKIPGTKGSNHLNELLNTHTHTHKKKNIPFYSTMFIKPRNELELRWQKELILCSIKYSLPPICCWT